MFAEMNTRRFSFVSPPISSRTREICVGNPLVISMLNHKSETKGRIWEHERESDSFRSVARTKTILRALDRGFAHIFQVHVLPLLPPPSRRHLLIYQLHRASPRTFRQVFRGARSGPVYDREVPRARWRPYRRNEISFRRFARITFGPRERQENSRSRRSSLADFNASQDSR